MFSRNSAWETAAAVPALNFAPDAISLVLLDLDGTLVDSYLNLAHCGNRMLGQLGLAERDPELARNWVGNGVERFVKRVLGGSMDADPDATLFAEGLEIFRRIYATHAGEDCRVYPGVIEALDRLSGKRPHLACVTNKAEPFASAVLSSMGLLSRLELVVAGNTTARKKPDPMPLCYAADYFALPQQACLMVGDSSHDVAAARAAGFPVICVSYGYNHGIDIHEAKPDLVVDDLRQVADLFV